MIRSPESCVDGRTRVSSNMLTYRYPSKSCPSEILQHGTQKTFCVHALLTKVSKYRIYKDM